MLLQIRSKGQQKKESVQFQINQIVSEFQIQEASPSQTLQTICYLNLNVHDDDADDDKDDHSLCSRRGAPCSLIGAHACPLKNPSLSFSMRSMRRMRMEMHHNHEDKGDHFIIKLCLV